MDVAASRTAVGTSVKGAAGEQAESNMSRQTKDIKNFENISSRP
jgi:hypothetical protein